MSAPFPSGARLAFFESLDSTSLEARRRVGAGEAGPLWIIAARQTAGYGRRGSAWLQHDGDFAGTFLFRSGAARETLPQLSFVAALSVSDAIMRHAPRARLTLKWPNDVLADGGKIAGLLLELLRVDDPVIALGVGVNIISAPDGVAYRTARLIDNCDGAPIPDPKMFGVTLDETFAAWRALWMAEGFAPIREAWLMRAESLGRRMKVETAGRIVEGLMEGIDEEGALLIRTDTGGVETISAGVATPA
jgi:BirA family biotin operon repressor/biotin-[acetyl-CoA-carboxylase] ligase